MNLVPTPLLELCLPKFTAWNQPFQVAKFCSRKTERPVLACTFLVALTDPWKGFQTRDMQIEKADAIHSGSVSFEVASSIPNKPWAASRQDLSHVRF